MAYDLAKDEKGDLIFEKIKKTVLPTSKYSLEYLRKMLKTKKLYATVELQMSHDYPMELTFDCRDKLRLYEILAPRIAND